MLGLGLEIISPVEHKQLLRGSRGDMLPPETDENLHRDHISKLKKGKGRENDLSTT